ncbi:GNAT family N-acetyltransferase [[Ruminococcus] torques]|uniref:GNAT family N-acetyltransferase n=1 Tax=[Ruminococcus] torques TaxID=33039 RepID=UPI003AB9B4DA
MFVRGYQMSDCKEITELFYNTVHTINAKDYTKEQLDVWATGQADLEKWNQSLQEHYSIVAIDNKIIVGFGDIDKDGYLDRLFVHSNYQGKGVAKIKLLSELTEHTIAEEIEAPHEILFSDLG